MKKIILSAAIAATMSVPAFADISIKGDAHFRYTAKDTGTVQTNPTSQRVRLHVTGKSGDTTVKLGLRNDGGTRVSDGIRGAGGDSDDDDFPNGTGSPRGLRDGSSAGNSTSSNAAFNVDYLFLTTKIGGLNIKVGDWWATTGVGLVRKGVPITEGIVFGTKISGINASIKTVADSSENFFTFKGKLGGFKVALQTSDHDTDGYFDVMFKGKASGVGIAGEFWSGDVFDANVVHLWKTVNGITWHVARAEWDAQVAGGSNRFAANSKFSPLGVSILGSAPGVNGRTAIGNVNRRHKSY